MREESMVPTFVTERPVCPFNKCDMESEHLIIARGWDFEYRSTLAEIELMQCQKCEVVSPRQLPVVEALATIYPENYYAFDETKLENPMAKAIVPMHRKNASGGAANSTQPNQPNINLKYSSPRSKAASRF